MSLEQTLPNLAVLVLALSGGASLLGQRREPLMLGLLAGALWLLALALALRWVRLGHGPFFNLYEILASNLFSLGLVSVVLLWRRPELRASARIVLPVLLTLGVWLLATPAKDSHFHPTYDTAWLWVHLLAGKLFLGLTLSAVGIALLVPLRRILPACVPQAPDDAGLDRQAWQLLRWALMFESAMLVAGAVWAQGAWGRYWAWDPLESWAFLTWLGLAGALHLRQGYRVGPGWAAGMAAGVFVLAFLTFFGVPFLSTAPHKGMI